MFHIHSRHSLSFTAVGVLVALVAGCDFPQTDTGCVDISVAALSSADVTSVSVAIVRTGYTKQVQLTKGTTGTWSAIVGNLEAVGGYTFTAVAKNNQGQSLYQGQAVDVKIKKGSTPTLVAIEAQQLTPPTPFANTVPIIDSFVVSSNAIAPGDVITATVTAHDPDVGDNISLAWASSPAVGVFSASGATTTSWTAPNVEGDVTLAISATDSHGAAASSTVVVHVVTRNGVGEASTTVALNTWPVVSNITANPGFIVLGQPVSLVAAATDSDGDPLTYAWTSTCASGSFSAPSAAQTSFTMPSGATDAGCSIDVLVQDNRGGSTHGQTVIPVGAPASLGNPVVVFSAQSPAAVEAGGTATFMVEALDPQGSALTFAWQASGGLLSNQTSTVGSSQATWTAPATSSASFTISAVVTDALGLSTQLDYTIETSSL